MAIEDDPCLGKIQLLSEHVFRNMGTYAEKVSEEWREQEKCNASNNIFSCFIAACEINADKKHTLNGRTSNKGLVRLSLTRFNNACHLIRDGENGALEIPSTIST